MAYAAVSKTVEGNLVRVQLPPSALEFSISAKLMENSPLRFDLRA